MSHQDIINALSSLRPGACWNLNGDTTDGLVWLDTVQTRPTDADISAAITAYVPPPSIQDQLTALQKQLTALQNKG